MGRWFFIFLLCGTFAQSAELSQLNQDLRWQRPAQDYLTLNVADTEILVLHQTQTRAQALGSALLLNDAGFSSAERLQWLASTLNKAGWDTYTMPIAALHLAEAELPAATTSDKTGTTAEAQATQPVAGFSWQAADNETTLVATEQQIAAQLEAWRQQAGGFRGFLLVIAEGQSAAWVTKLIAEGKFSADALVIIGPFWPHQQHNQRIPLLLRSIDAPVLDIQPDNFNPWSIHTAAQRRVAAIQSFKTHYRQRLLAGFSLLQPEQYPWLSKEIIGWTRSLGW